MTDHMSVVWMRSMHMGASLARNTYLLQLAKVLFEDIDDVVKEQEEGRRIRVAFCARHQVQVVVSARATQGSSISRSKARSRHCLPHLYGCAHLPVHDPKAHAHACVHALWQRLTTCSTYKAAISLT